MEEKKWRTSGFHQDCSTIRCCQCLQLLLNEGCNEMIETNDHHTFRSLFSLNRGETHYDLIQTASSFCSELSTVKYVVGDESRSSIVFRHSFSQFPFHKFLDKKLLKNFLNLFFFLKRIKNKKIKSLF